jgi:hypothetical protein
LSKNHIKKSIYRPGKVAHSIGRIVFEGQPRPYEDPISVSKLAMVAITCDPRYIGRKIVVQIALGKNAIPYSKQLTQKGLGALLMRQS